MLETGAELKRTMLTVEYAAECGAVWQA